MREKFLKRNNQKTLTGFTLIELLVVIAIIGLLASVVLVLLGDARQKSRDARRWSDVRQISTAMEMYYQAQTPASYPDLNDNRRAILAGDMTLQPYLNIVPVDPINAGSQVYYWRDRGQNTTCYCVWVELEKISGSYIIATAKGVKQTTVNPQTVDCCAYNF
ncbi:type II secretion system GspH family protein [Patescibacteria group bacterium]|nr:type II secretion system GspH family protein [Patescibacteria group bacterium]